MLLDADFQLINEEFYANSVTPEQHDLLLEDGWRHFGTHFFRYNLGIYDNEIRLVLPLRIQLKNFKLSKSQRRVLRRNEDAEVSIRPVSLNDETLDLFDRHKRRFKTGEPATIYDFLDRDREPVVSPGRPDQQAQRSRTARERALRLAIRFVACVIDASTELERQVRPGHFLVDERGKAPLIDGR